MNTWRRAGSTKRDDVPELGERQSQPAALLNECQDAKHVRCVYAIAGPRTTGRWKEAAGLVQSQCLATEPTSRRDLTDEQATKAHAVNVDLSPWGKVKTSRR